MKKTLRQIKLLERLAHHPVEKTKKDRLILKGICNLPEFKKAKNILFYTPIKGEVDISKILKKSKTKRFVLSRINGNKLDLHYIKDLSQTKENKFKILEPQKNLPKAKPQDIDLAIIPGVVFSDNGHRIGYGKGFYDRFLKKTLAVKIGVAYRFQIVKNIPGEKHDVPMEIIITENKTMRIKHNTL